MTELATTELLRTIVDAMAILGAFTIVMIVVAVVALYQDGREFDRIRQDKWTTPSDLNIPRISINVNEPVDTSKTERHLRLLKDE